MIMVRLLVLSVCSLLVLAHEAATDHPWGYLNNGASRWSDHYPACGGDSQSPIDIRESTFDEELEQFEFTNYSTNTNNGMELELFNNGHSVGVTITSGRITIREGGLDGTYRAAQFHIHVGSSSARGSEHKIHGQQYQGELHIVHYKESLGSLAQAATQNRGLAVLGFFLEQSESGNGFLGPLEHYLYEVYEPGTKFKVPNSTSLTAFTLESILPENHEDFYRYDGSLTTPGCHESVVWTVFKDTIKIDRIALQNLRASKSSESVNGVNIYLVDNYRPVQPLGDRTVRRNFKGDKWGYLDNGALHWADFYRTCGHESQSPIDIGESTVAEIKEFEYGNYDTTDGIVMELSNNGHSAGVKITSGHITIRGGGLDGTYRAAQFHMHWGSKRWTGSEHKLHGAQYQGELHIVHYKESLGSLENAATKKRGLAVLGFFLEEWDEDNPALKPFMDYLLHVKYPYTTFTLPTAFTLESILPESHEDFYRYDGSLTTPGCYESVVWTVFKDTIKLSDRQLNQLRHLLSSETVDGEKVYLSDNYRPVQPLGNRTVFRNFEGYEAREFTKNFPYLFGDDCV